MTILSSKKIQASAVSGLRSSSAIPAAELVFQDLFALGTWISTVFERWILSLRQDNEVFTLEEGGLPQQAKLCAVKSPLGSALAKRSCGPL